VGFELRLTLGISEAIPEEKMLEAKKTLKGMGENKFSHK
jgi:hypothetical protein